MTLIKNIKTITMVQAAAAAKKDLLTQVKKEVKSLREEAASPDLHWRSKELVDLRLSALEGLIATGQDDRFDFTREIEEFKGAVTLARKPVYEARIEAKSKYEELARHLKTFSREEYSTEEFKKALAEKKAMERKFENLHGTFVPGGEFVKESYEKALFRALGGIKGEENQIRFLKALEGENMLGTDVPAGGSYMYPNWDEGHGGWDQDLTFSRQWPVVATKNKVVAFHGIHFIVGDRSKVTMKQLLKNANGVLGQFDTCVADMPLGTIGFIVKGGVRVAFGNDSWSGPVMKKGARSTSNVYSWTDHMEDPSQEEFDDMDFYSKNPEGDYAEGWMLPEEIWGVFVQHEDASASWIKIAKALAKQHGVEVYIVDEDSRVGDMGIIEGYPDMDEHNKNLNSRDISDIPDEVVFDNRKCPE